MENNNLNTQPTETTMEIKPRRNIWRVVRIIFAVIIVLYIGLVIYRIPAAKERLRTQEAVTKIHAQKLTLADVMGQNLPPEPDPALKDATLEGIDKNNNGIRDDVELSIFKLHPDSARIREAELQYAMELQAKLVDVFNSDTWITLAKYESGIDCIVDVASDKYTDIKDQIKMSDEWGKEVRDLVFNTQSRISKVKDTDKYQVAFSTGTKSCAIDLKQFPN